MKNVTNSKDIFGEEVGTISISIYKDNTGVSSFHVDAENDNVIQASYVIEDILKTL